MTWVSSNIILIIKKLELKANVRQPRGKKKPRHINRERRSLYQMTPFPTDKREDITYAHTTKKETQAFS